MKILDIIRKNDDIQFGIFLFSFGGFFLSVLAWQVFTTKFSFGGL